jgi:4-hydroxy-4-methyl-2-oxoglutarate aldolase
MNTKSQIAMAVTWMVVIYLSGCSQLTTGVQKDADSSDPLVEGFKLVAIASVADAIDQVVGEPGYMNYDMRPVVGGAFVGRARTTVLRPASKLEATTQLSLKHAIEMIDSADVGDVAVIVVEDGLNIAGIGGLMATAAQARGMAGAVIDGAVRDVEEIRRLGLPVFGRSVAPATAVGRYATLGRDITVQCAGIAVNPGDIIVAGTDGVLRVPKDKAEDVLKVAQDIDAKETKMVPFIKKNKSIQKAVAEFNRI